MGRPQAIFFEPTHRIAYSNEWFEFAICMDKLIANPPITKSV